LKAFFSNIQTILVVVLVALLFYQRSCSFDRKTVEPTVVTKIEVKYDTVQSVVERYVPKWRDRIINHIDTITTPIDTLAILKDYYAKYAYTDTLKVDTIGYVVINDTITRNIILSRDIHTNLVIPATTVTNEIYPRNRELYWGVGVQGRSSQISYLGGELLYKDKRDHIYGVGLGINQDFTPVISGRLYWKIMK
tara:strand:- start:2837 stop:3418 length:582 start_codon:yes stop_codon:yes gene_type:complete